MKNPKKSIIYVVTLAVITVFLVSCTYTKTTSSSNSSSKNSQLTKEQEEAINNGYQIGEYRLVLTKNQKIDEKQNFINNNSFEANFKKIQDDIDLTKKINIKLYGLNYSPEEERYTLGTFLVNTSNITIKELHLTVTTNFKTIGDVTPTVLVFKGDDFAELAPKSFVTLALYGDAPLESADLLMENKGPDITFKITDLEINGEKVDNLNEH